ncbi:MAG: ATP phosphoribosyltransferase regulatory subunit [Alphaproteobacteria bacterium]|nr:ATP phosphoribosyltransferase regulatory subunit [Alphaproteobacteria bacterium]
MSADSPYHFALLPPGFFDVIEEQASSHERVRGVLLAHFQQYGYQLVRPPLMEFETSLFADSNQPLRKHAFQLIDPISHHMLGIRPDITTQVARIAVSRLAYLPRPLRLCYAGEVLRTKGEGIEGKRQRTQVGFELLGSDSVSADSEVVRVALGALSVLGITDVAIDLIMPPIVRDLFKHLNLSLDTQLQLKEALSKKDLQSIKVLAGDDHHYFIPLITLYGSVQDTLLHIRSLPLTEKTLELCGRLETIVAMIARHYPHVHVTIDAAEADYFDYHTGIGFSIFSRHTAVELGRGGRYIVQQSQHLEPGCGFTLYVDSLAHLIAPQPASHTVLVAPDCENGVIHSLQQQGMVVVFADDSDTLEQQALNRTYYGWVDEAGILHAVA